jgi:hypothetical protein
MLTAHLRRTLMRRIRHRIKTFRIGTGSKDLPEQMTLEEFLDVKVNSWLGKHGNPDIVSMVQSSNQVMFGDIYGESITLTIAYKQT